MADVTWVKIVVPAMVSAFGGFALATWMLATYKEKVNQLEKRSDKFEASINELNTSIATMKGERNVYVQKKSPLSLTDKGKALYMDSKGQRFLEENKNDLLQLLEEKKPTNAYDVQVYAKNIIEDCASKKEFDDVKNYTYTEGLDLESVLEVISIALRDEYFDLHPNTLPSNTKSSTNPSSK